MLFPYLASLKKSVGTISSQRGFGLVELMVSISIMVVVVGIILSRQSAFNSAVLLRSQAYEIAFKIREIQLSAVSASDESNTGTFRSVLGLNFTTLDLVNQSYVIFRDTPPPDSNSNGFFDSGEEFGVQGVIDNRFFIRDIRAVGDSLNSYDGGDLSIVFVRPNFDARFFDRNSEVEASSIEIDIARIDADLTDVGIDAVRTLEISAAGQIGVR